MGGRETGRGGKGRKCERWEGDNMRSRSWEEVTVRRGMETDRVLAMETKEEVERNQREERVKETKGEMEMKLREMGEI